MARKRFDTPRLRRASDLPYSVSAGEQEVTLYSGDAQSLLRHYNFTSAAIFKIGINLRKIGVPEEKVQETERLVYEEILKPIQEDISKEIARLENQFGNPRVVKFTKPFTGTAEIQYPRAKLLLALLIDLDQLIFRVNQLWHAETIGDAEYLRLTDGFRDRLKESQKRIARIAREAVQLAMNQKEDAEVEAGVKAMAADAASGAPENETPKPAGRRGRRTAESAPETEKPKEDQEKGPETPPVEAAGEHPVSPFAGLQ